MRRILSMLMENQPGALNGWLEQEGYQFDSADGTFKILLEKFTDQFKPLFELESFRVTIEKDKDQPCSAHATIKISVGDKKEITASSQTTLRRYIRCTRKTP